MRIVRAAAVVVALAVPSLAAADPESSAKDAFTQALGANDAVGVRAVLASKVKIKAAEFYDPVCNKKFGGNKRRTISKPQLDKLVVCLMSIGSESVTDHWTLVETRGRISAITVEHDLIQPVELEGVESGVADGVEGGVMGGNFGGTPPPPPPPPPGPHIETVAPTALEAQRLTGNKVITPDDATKQEIGRNGKAKVVASFKLCVDERGAVATVTRLKASGFPAYDTKLEAGIRTWTYKPFLVHGAAVPVCTAVTFVYSQK